MSATDTVELDQPYLRRLVDVDRIRAQLRSLVPPYDIEHWLIPLPLWATRPLDHDGETAWRTLRDDLRSADTGRPVCIYLHVPFCARKCPFCDCYSFRLSSGRDGERRRYVERLREELELWSELPGVASRPVSTVHLGGGTPTHLGPELLAELVECCRSRFTTTPRTEWALESTVRALTPEMIDTLACLGFRRLHLGIQTLDDPVRATIGRVDPARDVLDRVGETRSRGWVVSADLICGLPGQTVASFARDVETLVAAGIDGLSLYELLIYQQNRRWTRQQGLAGRSHLPNYLAFQVGAALLEHHGYRKNTFNHWAGPRDDNRYFTFPTRQEDCLAVGTIADGVLGDYHFRHLRYTPYLRAANRPGLHGGLRRTPYEQRMHELTTSILAGRVPVGSVPDLRRAADGTPLADRWLASGLMGVTEEGDLTLLTNGSWFAGNMVKELTGCYPERTLQG